MGQKPERQMLQGVLICFFFQQLQSFSIAQNNNIEMERKARGHLRECFGAVLQCLFISMPWLGAVKDITSTKTAQSTGKGEDRHRELVLFGLWLTDG